MLRPTLRKQFFAPEREATLINMFSTTLPNQFIARLGADPAELALPWFGRSLSLPFFFALPLIFARPWAARVVHPLVLLVAHFCVCHSSAFEMERNLPGFETLTPFDEQVRWTRLESGVRIFVSARAELSKQPRRLVVFATPNGNSIEQTLGCQAGGGIDWHFQIQHVAAQIRALRATDPDHEWILAVVQAPKLSWPMFRKENPAAAGVIHNIVRTLQTDCDTHDVVLC